MNIYLATRFSRRHEMREFATLLKIIGHTCVSRWINGSHDHPALGESREEFRRRNADEDRADLDRADCLIAFVAEERSDTRGGNHVEFGYALAQRQRVMLVGVQGNVFHCLPEVEHYENARACLAKLAGEVGMEVPDSVREEMLAR